MDQPADAAHAAARLLARVPLFASLSPEQQELVARQARPCDVAAGQAVLREGERGDEMYLIESGAFQVWCQGLDGAELVLARLEAGDWFGEQALQQAGGRRNASVRTLLDGRLWALSRAALMPVFEQRPDVLDRIKGLGEGHLRWRGGLLGARVFAELGLGTAPADIRIDDLAAGDCVFREGDPAERVYLVVAGRAQVTQRRGDAETPLSELLPGQFFGELAILHDAPRSATVRAAEPLRIASVDGAWFRDGAAGAGGPPRAVLESLASMYLLPRSGVRTLQAGRLDGHRCWTAINHMPDGRRIVSTRLADSAGFTARLLGAEDEGETLTHVDADQGLRRSVRVAVDGRVLALDVEGGWTRLGDALRLLVDGDPAHAWQIELFRRTGDLWPDAPRPLYDDDEVLCTCNRTTCGQLRAAIAEGCHSLDAVAARTGATLVCGGCTPMVKELLGHADWTPASVAAAETVADGVKRFQLRPLGVDCAPFLPGQHVVVQARVDDRWIQRAYTLSNAPGAAHYEITVKREQGGAFSRWLFERMRAHDLLRVSSPRGDYVAPADGDEPVVCLVGGIGMTPALAFARALAAHRRPAPLHVDHSVTRQDEAVCAGELRALARTDPRFSFELRITGAQGRIAAADVDRLRARFPGARWFLCGSTGFMDGVKALLLAQGVAEDRVRIELFNVAGAAVAPSAARAQAMPAPGEAADVGVGLGTDAGTGTGSDAGAGARAANGSPKGDAIAEGAPARCPVAAPQPAEAPRAARLEVPPSRRDEAAQFLRAFYAELGAPAAYTARWRQVEDEWDRTGTYVQTVEELSHAVRLAWRNSIRCVGRLYWTGLAVRDMRHVTTGEGMLDAVMDHIRLATNGGNLRPTITVFPPAAPDGSTPRLWSPQLFRYAGYRLASGKVLGDPANVDFTDEALRLGWAPPTVRGAFDLLPVVVQAAGEAPRWREIPRERVLEVPINHPEHAWFAELGLRWYALPAVSNMRLDAGGLDYRAIPFNGWYQGTEIAARNFGDTYRYDLLPKLARRLGLDTSSDRTLWRDRALVELNVAVLHSFEAAGVTMMDHHASCRAFDKFEEIEKAAGRPVHALWNWLVPPISGSAVGLFHRGDDWSTEELKPNYYGQADPWTKGQAAAGSA